METEEIKEFHQAVVYLRTTQGPRSATAEQQRSVCLERCRQLGFEAADVMVLEDATDRVQASGVRQGFERLLTVAASLPTLLVVWQFDLLYRAPKDLKRLIDVAANRPLRVAAVRGAQIDLETAEGRFEADLLAVLSTHEDALPGRDELRSSRGDRHAR